MDSNLYWSAKNDRSIGPCPICGRDMVKGKSVNEHHLIPKSRKGRDTITIHVICHTKIHSLFTEKELEQQYFTVTRLLAHEEIQKFIKWVRKKDPEFVDRNRRSSLKSGKWKQSRRR